MLNALSLLLGTVPFVAALLLGLAVPLLGLLLYRHWAAGVGFVCLVFAADAAFFGNTRLQLGINVYSNDLAFVLLALVALARVLIGRDRLRLPNPPILPLSWLLFVLLFGISLVWGLANNGTKAGVHAREYFYAIAAASYAMSFRLGEREFRQALRALVLAGLALLLIAAYRWVVYYLPLPALLPRGGVWSPDGPIRVIASNEALLLAQLLVLGLFFAFGDALSRVARWAAPLWMAAVITLQHRSVWVAAAVGVVVAFAVSRAVQASRLAQLAALAAVLLLTALPLVFSERLSGISQEIERSAATAVAGQGTVHARLDDWKQTLAEWGRAGPRAWLVGQGFGRDPTRLRMDERGEQRLVRFGTHNHYLSMLTNVGLLGLVAFLVLVLGTAGRLYRLCRGGESGVAAPALLVLLLMQLAYYVPYAVDALQHLLLGAAVAYAGNASTRRIAAEPEAASEPAWRRSVAWR